VSKSNGSRGIGFLGLLGIVFVVLKLLEEINWSWLWVTCPFWIIPAIIITAFVVGMIAEAIGTKN